MTVEFNDRYVVEFHTPGSGAEWSYLDSSETRQGALATIGSEVTRAWALDHGIQRFRVFDTEEGRVVAKVIVAEA